MAVNEQNHQTQHIETKLETYRAALITNVTALTTNLTALTSSVTALGRQLAALQTAQRRLHIFGAMLLCALFAELVLLILVLLRLPE